MDHAAAEFTDGRREKIEVFWIGIEGFEHPPQLEMVALYKSLKGDIDQFAKRKYFLPGMANVINGPIRAAMHQRVDRVANKLARDEVERSLRPAGSHGKQTVVEKLQSIVKGVLLGDATTVVMSDDHSDPQDA